MTYADVILPLPLEGMFTYAVPQTMEDYVCFGKRVEVPLGKSKTYVGIVARVHGEAPEGVTIKDIKAVVDETPVIFPEQYSLWQWITSYYMSSIGEVYKAAMPAAFKSTKREKPKTETYLRLASSLQSEEKIEETIDKLRRLSRSGAQLNAFHHFLALSHWENIGRLYDGTTREEAGHQHFSPTEISKDELLNASHSSSATINSLIKNGILEKYEKEVGRLNKGGEPNPGNIKPLNTLQKEALERLKASMEEKSVTLLHGVTSCGKTEIYIHLIQEEIDKGKQVLYLLPEIALTVQMMERLRRVFGSRLGIYHSKYSDAEREEIWRKQLSDKPFDIILGARSAVFLPFRKLSLIIVDEEHENSFKQQEPAPRYHARSVAIMLASMSGAKTILGTATPCLESYHNAMTGKYGYVAITRRFGDVPLPEFQVVDIGDMQRRRMMTRPFSPQLLSAMKAAMERGRQVMLFQNRRGFAPMLECHQCGWVPRCQNCDVSLTYHKNTNSLVCHYCGRTYAVPAKCPCCEATDIRPHGFGTEKIEDMIMELFPEAHVARMDLDTTRTRNAYVRIIKDFSEGRTNILIGTQMISKGLDFDNVSLVGILNADAMLNYPDFRAYERAFMMMEQVGGRAGRKGERGLVIVQTRNPKMQILADIAANNYKAMYVSVAGERRAFRYPPFCRIVYVYLRHKRAEIVDRAAAIMAANLRQTLGDTVLGPDSPPVAMVRAMNIRKIIVKIEPGTPLATIKDLLLREKKKLSEETKTTSTQVFFDVDPE